MVIKKRKKRVVRVKK